MLELANSTNLHTLGAALHNRGSLGTNGWPFPELQEMLAGEKDDERRKVIAHAIDYISQFE